MTYTFNTLSWGTTGQGDWTSGAAGNSFAANQGVQITTGKTGANATSPRSFTNITKIEVQYCTNASSGVGAVTVQVGSGTEKSFNVTKPSSGGTTLKTATFNFSPAETGSVKVTGTCTTNSVFIYSVAITYSTEVSGEEYTLLTDPSDLSIGDTIVIVESKDNYALSTTQNTNNRGQTKDGWCFTSPTTIRVSSATYIQKLILGQSNSHWTFYAGSGYLYAASSSSNHLKTQATNNANGEWTISIGGSSPYNATITAQGSNSNNLLQYNSSLFSCYGSAQQAIRVFWHPRPKTVTWMVNGVETTAGSPTDEVEKGSKVSTLPTTPDVPSACSSKVFVGWTDEEYDEDDDPPSVLFTTADGAPTVDNDVTYYAVFATSSGEGSSHYEKVTSTGDITNDGKYLIVYESSSTSAIIFDGSLNPLDASPDTIMAPISTNTISATSHVKASEFTIDMTNKYIKSASNRYIYRSSYNNGMDESTTASAVTSIAISSNKFIVKGDEGTGGNSGKYTTLSYNTADAGGSTNGSRFRFYKTPSTDIYLYKYVAGASYSAYATTCVVACAEPTAASAGSFNSGTQKMPISWTSDAGKVDICYSTSSTKPDATPSASYTVVSNQTSSPVNLDVSGLSAGNYYCWVRSVCDASSTKSDWVAITGNTFTIPGHTLTITPSPAASGTFSQTSGQTVVEGRTVSITATPASGYTFSSWAVSGTSSTLSSTSTNPTTFTMGTANATVTATFSQIMVSSLTLRVQQTDQDDNTGDDLTMTCYPKEGQTGGNDPLSHTLRVLYDGALPSGALDKTVDWSVRVKAKEDADWTDVDFTGNALNSNSIINSFNKNTGLLKIASTEGTAEIKITAHDGSGVSAKVTITVANVAMTGVSVDPTSMSVYAGQKKQVAVTFTPANATDRSYSAGSSYTYVNIQNKAAATFNIEGKTSVTSATVNETVTVTTTDGSFTATVDVTIKPLPLVHFVDNVHNESFDDVVATTDGTTVTFAKATPTHDDLDEPGSGNSCEKTHLHLIGWIRGDWPAYVAYMNGTGSAPSNSDLTGATGYFYEAGAAITLTDAMHGKTFYAVWSKIE